MNNILIDIKTLTMKILNNPSCVTIICCSITAFVSYRIAQYNASKPEKIKIKQSQFKKVYLPLFRLLSEYPKTPSLDQANEIHKKFSYILDKNYELTFPQLHKLNEILAENIQSDSGFQKTYSIMAHQITIDYEILKKSLGYPSENVLAIFARMTFKQKAEIFISYFSFFFLLAFFILFPIMLSMFPEHPGEILLIAIGCFILYLIIILRLNKWVNNLKY